MIVRRVLLSPLLLILAVTAQLALVNRMPLPGGGATPDLVLLVVAALGVTAGPMTGLLAGFAGGLALDVAPPGGHLAGEYALVFCLVGYACGRTRELVQGSSAERSAITSLTVMALGVAAGEAGKAGLGLMVSDPNVTGPAIKHVLPAAVVYDLLLCPFVLWLVALVVGAPVTEHAPQVRFPQAFRWSPAFRLASAGAAPGLRLVGSSAPLVPPPLRSEPRLRLASGRSLFSSGTNPAFSTARPAASGGRPAKLNFSSSGRANQLGGASALRAARAANFQGKSPAKGWLRSGKPLAGTAAATRRPGSPGKGWARGDMRAAPVRRPSSPPKGWVRPSRRTPAQPGAWHQRSPGKGWARGPKPGTASPARRPDSPGKGWARTGLRPAATDGWHRQSPGKGWARTGLRPAAADGWHRRSPGKGWLRPVKPPAPARVKSPGKGWARSAKPAPPPRMKSPGKGWLRPAKAAPAPRRKSPGKGWLHAAKPPKQNWYTRSPSTRWLRRGRRKRLLLGGRR
jgi:rod shape-determining protein MreD